MKIFKLFFSKILIILVLFLLQIGLFIWPYFALREYATLIDQLSRLVGLIVFVAIVNKRETPEFKLPWIFLVLATPFFGLIFYGIFANPRMSKRYARLHERTEQLAAKHLALSEDERSSVLALAREKKDVFVYLESNSYLPTTDKNRITYLDGGERFLTELLAELSRAEKFIFMEYFIIDRGKMWDSVHSVLAKKASEGVEVRFVYDDVGSLGNVRNGYYKTLRKEGILCHKFNPVRPQLSGIYNNRDHRKITVVDGRVAFTGGVNIADEYINAVNRFGHWKDSAVKIEGAAVKSLTATFLQTYDVLTMCPSDYDKYLAAPPETFEDRGVVNFFGDGPKPYYKEQIGENDFINLISSAKRYVYISTPYLITDHRLSTAIAGAAERGLDVRIITPHVPDKKLVFNMTRSNYAFLQDKGVKIYEYTPGFIHAKMLVADDDIAFVGTINLDYRSLVHHYECGLVMYDTPCISDIKRDFDAVIARSQLMDKNGFKMNKFSRLIRALLQLFAPLL